MNPIEFEVIDRKISKDEMATLRGGYTRPADHTTNNGDTYIAASDAWNADSGRYCQFDCPKPMITVGPAYGGYGY